MVSQTARVRKMGAAHLRALVDRLLARALAPVSTKSGQFLEALESRVLLSVGPLASPTFRLDRALASPFAGLNASGSSSPTGLAPSAILQAYGMDHIMFGSLTGDGTGQTIAIVDAFNDPNIATDLATFDSTFGLATASLTVVKVGSPANDPQSGASWAVETSLDVEWAHAVAPGASIVLVEANSDSTNDLFSAVNTARRRSGVSVVSMSWGTLDGEYDGETFNDATLTTPRGHNGVTFVASAGDTGGLVEYPAASPNVLSVGGTKLTAYSNGNYQYETAWGSSGGGLSQYESEPSYQIGVVPSSVDSSDSRAVPDVAADADPKSGVAVVDSWDFTSGGPWVTVGGTSLAAPLWAGVIAIINQGRVAAGSKTFDGVSQTLPAIYALNSSNLHDITSGDNGNPALPGYDLVTGLGSPIVNLLAPAMATPHSLTVTGVFIGSTNWSSFFTDYLTSNYVGNAFGYAVPAGSAQLSDLPWTNINQISVRFSENVTINSSALTLVGVNQASYTPTGFTYNGNTQTATWTLGAPLGADKLIVSLSGTAISDSSGNKLAGAWTNGVSSFPSGGDQAGTDFDFQFNVVPGDINQSGSTNATDIVFARIDSGQSGQVFADLDGSDTVDGTDISLTQQNVGAQLPSGNPVSPAYVPALIVPATMVSGDPGTDTTADAADTLTDGSTGALAVVPPIVPSLTPVPAQPAVEPAGAPAAQDDVDPIVAPVAPGTAPSVPTPATVDAPVTSVAQVDPAPSQIKLTVPAAPAVASQPVIAPQNPQSAHQDFADASSFPDAADQISHRKRTHTALAGNLLVVRANAGRID
jgi:hypothetical protein